MVSYFLLILSALMFSASFLGNKLFQKETDSSVKSTFDYMFLGAIVTCVSMLVTTYLNGIKVEVTGFSFLMAALYSLNSFLMTYFAIKSFQYANLSVYSMFIMLGSIVIPSIYGIVFANETVTLNKIICFVFIFGALFLGVNKGKSQKKAIIYYFLVFIGNGMAGVISKIHQSFTEINVSTDSFLLITGIIKLAVSGIVLLYIYRKINKTKPTLKACSYAIGGGLIHSIGNYLNIFALISVPVMIHSVITTGMVLVFSALLGLLYKEKLTAKGIVSILFALIATVFSIL